MAVQRLAFFERIRSEGPVLRLRMGRTPTILVNDHLMAREILGDSGDTFARGQFFSKVRPLVGNGLGSSDGAFHLRQRRMVQPAFSHEHPGYDVDALLGGIKTRVESWRPGAVVDMAREMDALANELINTALFSSDKVTGDADTIRDTIAGFIAGVGVRSMVAARDADVSEMVGTTRSRVGYFLKRFSDEGLLVHSGSGQLTVHETRLACYVAKV
ncbi:cytochrome P450 [Streptomyces tendae]|uniref:cytochrome P450 n=1 Tax=Streptomyces tendae TaxID=1932 RepID=UPI0033E1E4B3